MHKYVHSRMAFYSGKQVKDSRAVKLAGFQSRTSSMFLSIRPSACDRCQSEGLLELYCTCCHARAMVIIIVPYMIHCLTVELSHVTACNERGTLKPPDRNKYSRLDLLSWRVVRFKFRICTNSILAQRSKYFSQHFIAGTSEFCTNRSWRIS